MILEKPKTECWELEGNRNSQGYVRITFNGRLWRGHRLIWVKFKGPIPDGMDVLHRCNNPPCARLDHLYLGTDLENSRDRDEGGRHGTAKLSPAEVIEIRRLRQAGVTVEKVAAQFNVSKCTVSQVANRRRWAHVLDP